MAMHSSILAWEILWAEKPGRKQSSGLKRVGHDLVSKQQQETWPANFICLWVRERPFWAMSSLPLRYFMVKSRENILPSFRKIRYNIKVLSCVWLFPNPWTIVRQAPVPMRFFRQEYWSALSFPISGDLPDPRIQPTFFTSLALAGRFLITSATRKAHGTNLEAWKEKWKWSCSVVSDSLRLHGLQPTRFLCPWDFPGKNAGVGYHFLPQDIFPTQGLNPGLLHCRQMLYRLSHQGSPFISKQILNLCGKSLPACGLPILSHPARCPPDYHSPPPPSSLSSSTGALHFTLHCNFLECRNSNRVSLQILWMWTVQFKWQHTFKMKKCYWFTWYGTSTTN